MIHVVIGAPCSGKSTYVDEHAEEGDIKVDFDRIADCLGNSNPHEAEGRIKGCAFAVRDAAIDYLLKNPDADGWVIHTKPTEEQMEAYEAADAAFIELDTDMETCLERAESDGRPQRTFEGIYAYFGKEKAKMNVKTKTYELKSENGTISGYASTWTREPDSYGDIVAKGAFAECIERLKDEGKVLPLLFNHDSYDLRAFIGSVVNLEEDDHGLKFDATFDDTEEGQRARTLALDGRLCKFSFAYDVLDEGQVELEDGRKANELRKLNIHEVSLVMYPANPDTSVTEVKGAEKAGRRSSKADEDELDKIAKLAAEITEVVNGLLESDEPIDEQDPEEEPEVKPEEPGEANDEEQKARTEALLKEAEILIMKGEQP